MKHININTTTTKTRKAKFPTLPKALGVATKSSTILREETISLIKAELSSRKGERCVIALVGKTGSGKSIVISQLLQSLSEDVTLYDPLQYDFDIPPLEKLRGISIIESPWKFPNTKNAIAESFKSDRDALIILVCMDNEEIRDVCGDMPTTIIPIEHWQYLING